MDTYTTGSLCEDPCRAADQQPHLAAHPVYPPSRIGFGTLTVREVKILSVGGRQTPAGVKQVGEPHRRCVLPSQNVGPGVPLGQRETSLTTKLHASATYSKNCTSVWIMLTNSSSMLHVPRLAEISHEDRVAVINSTSPEQAQELLEKRCPILTPKRMAKPPEDEAAFCTPNVEKSTLMLKMQKNSSAMLSVSIDDHIDSELVPHQLAALYLVHSKGQVVEKYLDELESLQNTLSNKAYQIPHETRVEMINSASLQDAEALLKQLSQRETRQSMIIQDGYNQPYLNSEGIVAPTLEILKRHASSWISTQYSAPYTAPIGPSMSGKTRLLMEWSKQICVVYICIRPTTSTGHPPQSRYANTNFFLLAILRSVADYFESQTGEKEERLAKWIAHSFPKKGRSGDPPFWTKVMMKMNEFPRSSHSHPNIDIEFPKVMKRVNDSAAFLGNPALRVLLAIDEARERYLHQADFFSILAHATPRVSNLRPPPEIYDPSNRIGKSTQVRLYPPIYKFPAFDVKVPGDLPATWQQLSSAFRLLRYGSPFWSVYADSASRKNLDGYTFVRELSQLALETLLCTTEPPTDPSLPTTPQTIALLGSTIQPQLYGVRPLNNELVSSHGAQCMYIDPSREMLISEYPSQFTFSLVANEYLAHDDARWIQCIRALTSTHCQGYISSGDVDKLVTQIILLRAMQETTIGTQVPMTINTNINPEKLTLPFGSPVPLLEFLMTSTGLPEEALIKKLGSITKANRDNLFRRGYIFWNHFKSVNHTPTTPADLLRKLGRGLAVHCQSNESVFDQIFPVYLQSDPTETLKEDHITFCGVQVKNRKQSGQLEDNSHKWTPDSAGMTFKKTTPVSGSLLQSERHKTSTNNKNINRKFANYPHTWLKPSSKK
ncbi:hypothetical protein PCASD_25984 [Puccinia coronata f. sp. avenae]|uniref:Uncharacterized protein n=1 Tax=Puccinia coronata f. sp. avenae TaxID=200324 RepID=A0A2N5RWC0_9BASI|nr:hypothetical protein PCASD_25984 [Puccinia coronata f. sp. avenae]